MTMTTMISPFLNKALLPTLLASSALLLGQPTAGPGTLSIESSELQYHQGSLSLCGQVVIEHDLGKISADRLLILPEEGQKKMKPHDLALTDHVRIALRDGGELSCSVAYVDCQATTAIFAGDAEQEFVIYNDYSGSQDQADRKNSIVLKSREMSVQIGKEESSDKKIAGSVIRFVVADRQVTLDYNRKLTAAADHVEYQRFTNGLLTLQGNVCISQKGMGTLTNPGEVQLTQNIVPGNKQLKSIESKGESVLSYREGETDVLHILICYGTIFVDHEQLHATMESPLDDKGVVLEGKQIVFRDNMGEVHADRLYLTYAMVDGELKPSQLRLEGNIRILNRCAANADRKEEFLQYALADRVEYQPDAKVITLSADENKRVLLIDRLNQMQVSAKALKIRRDERTARESIEGVGDVRFALLEQELDQIEKMFPKAGQ